MSNSVTHTRTTCDSCPSEKLITIAQHTAVQKTNATALAFYSSNGFASLNYVPVKLIDIYIPKDIARFYEISTGVNVLFSRGGWA